MNGPDRSEDFTLLKNNFPISMPVKKQNKTNTKPRKLTQEILTENNLDAEKIYSFYLQRSSS